MDDCGSWGAAVVGVGRGKRVQGEAFSRSWAGGQVRLSRIRDLRTVQDDEKFSGTNGEGWSVLPVSANIREMKVVNSEKCETRGGL